MHKDHPFNRQFWHRQMFCISSDWVDISRLYSCFGLLIYAISETIMPNLVNCKLGLLVGRTVTVRRTAYASDTYRALFATVLSDSYLY
jgi:hypothetical protein